MAAEILATGPFVLLSAFFLWWNGAFASFCLSLLLAFGTSYALRRAFNRRLQPDARCGVLVTGCSSGIGMHAAMKLVEQGATVFACVRSEENKNALMDKIDPQGRSRLIPIFLDVTNQAQIRQAVTQVKEHLQSTGGYLHGVVNNAGYSETSPLELISLDKLQRQFDVNVVGQVAVSQAFLPLLRLAKSRPSTRRLVFISSGLGVLTTPGATPYCASKHALESISDGFRMELRHWGIDVVCIQPGALNTQFMTTYSKTEEMGIAKLTVATDTSDAKSETPQAVSQDVLAHYRECMKKQSAQTIMAADVSYGADAIFSALFDKAPFTRYFAGPDVQFMPLITKLPDRVKDFLMGRAYN